MKNDYMITNYRIQIYFISTKNVYEKLKYFALNSD